MEKYLNTLKKLGINTDAYHWRANKKNEKRAQKALEELFETNGVSYEKPVRICGVDGCYNPLHFTQNLGKDIVPSSLDEVLELTEMIDTNELKDLGFSGYLEMFNKDNPLPAKKRDFFIACNRKLRRKGLPVLSDSVLWEKEENKNE